MSQNRSTKRVSPLDDPRMRSEDDDWPSIADAIAIWNERGLRYSARLRARAHIVNGLRVIYGEGTTRAAGEIIEADGDVAAAIRRVGKEISAPPQLIADCIASIKVRGSVR